MFTTLRYLLSACCLFTLSCVVDTADADPLPQTSTYYRLQADLRPCPSPLCGGALVSRVNQLLTTCADGSLRPQCHVSEVDYSRLGLSGRRLADFQAAALAGRALLRGAILPGANLPPTGPLGKLTVTEGWLAATALPPEGPFFRVRDNGIRCIVAPCFSIHEAKLNTTESRNVSGVDLTRNGAAEAQIQAGQKAIATASLLVAGINLLSRNPPAANGVDLVASQFYLQVTPGK